MTEFRLFDSPGADVAEVVTDGETFKPFVNAINRVADEARVQVSEDGLSVCVVDPANVFMADVTLGSEAFDTYDVDRETTIGPNLDTLKSTVRRARKASDDQLTLSIQERELTATVARGYENHNVVSQGTMDLIDPDAVRQSPDIPDLEWAVDVTVDTAPFTDALSYAVGVADHVQVVTKGVNQHATALYLGGETDTREEAAAIDGVETDDTAQAIYSADYMADILAGVNQVGAESVRVRLDDEYPLQVIAEREDVPFRVEYTLSPRVRPDD